MKKIIINVFLAIIAIAGLAWTSTHNGLISLLGMIPLYVGVLYLIKLNTNWLEEY